MLTTMQDYKANLSLPENNQNFIYLPFYLKTKLVWRLMRIVENMFICLFANARRRLVVTCYCFLAHVQEHAEPECLELRRCTNKHFELGTD